MKSSFQYFDGAIADWIYPGNLIAEREAAKDADEWNSKLCNGPTYDQRMDAMRFSLMGFGSGFFHAAYGFKFLREVMRPYLRNNLLLFGFVDTCTSVVSIVIDL
jgi:hypothetical protein